MARDNVGLIGSSSSKSASLVAGATSARQPTTQSADDSTGTVLVAIYRTLLSHYGPQHWWPTITGSHWEVMLGAVLVQRTTWRNADRAIANLQSALGSVGLSDPAALLSMPDGALIDLLRPAGHFNRKPRTLKLLARLVLELGDADAIATSHEATAQLRVKLLNIWGIGPETADAILLYALGRPVFVADAYALRLAARWGLLSPTATYDEVQSLFAENLPQDALLFNEYHALIVEHGKQLCRPLPLCDMCPLNKPVRLDGVEATATWRCPRRLVASEEGAK